MLLVRTGFVASTTSADLVEAIIHGAVKRVRPKAMTVCAAFMGLLPILWSTEPART
jgi:Cu/Ag efflux pump CusA